MAEPRIKEELDTDAMKGILSVINNGIDQNLLRNPSRRTALMAAGIVLDVTDKSLVMR